MLADANIGKIINYLQLSLRSQELEFFLEDEGIFLKTFRDLGLDNHMRDRPLWNLCQQEGMVLFTDDRNNDGPDSLLATLNDSWRDGHLPVLTPSNKRRLERDREYCDRLAGDVAGLLIGIMDGQLRDQPRIYAPLN